MTSVMDVELLQVATDFGKLDVSSFSYLDGQLSTKLSDHPEVCGCLFEVVTNQGVTLRLVTTTRIRLSFRHVQRLFQDEG